MLVQYCVHPQVEIILFAIMAVKHLISHRTFFHTNIPALGFKVLGEEKKNQASKLHFATVERKRIQVDICCYESDCACLTGAFTLIQGESSTFYLDIE